MYFNEIAKKKIMTLGYLELAAHTIKKKNKSKTKIKKTILKKKLKQEIT